MKYAALLVQSGEDNPQAIVQKNNTGASISWTRDSAGVYFGDASAPIFDGEMTSPFIQPYLDDINGNMSLHIQRLSDERICVFTKLNGLPSDGVLSYTAIKINIY